MSISAYKLRSRISLDVWNNSSNIISNSLEICLVLNKELALRVIPAVTLVGGLPLVEHTGEDVWARAHICNYVGAADFLLMSALIFS